jgi:RES domain-containing protein
MHLWRISNHESLDGAGGLRAPGRWHNQGSRVVYFAESASGALVEHLVHLELRPGIVAETFKLMKNVGDDSIETESVRAEDLPAQWMSQLEVTRQIGDTWLQKKRSALLFVPSAIVPETSNLLLNPHHADAARLQTVWHQRFQLDPRLLYPRSTQ